MLRATARTLVITLLPLTALAQTSPQRHFVFHYAFTIKKVPAGEPLRVWIPLAHTGPGQTVRVLSQSGDLPTRRAQEQEYGNWILYAEIPKADRSEYHFSVDYDVLRHEQKVLVDGKPFAGVERDRSHVQLARFLQPDKLVPTAGLPAQLAVEQTRGATSEIAKARALYDYVFRTLKYDKSGTGWGNGDVLWACDSKRGNCTDFHSLFIAMARSQHIPARFEIGFQLPPEQHSADVAGYHCWADFYVQSLGWVPVDISEAWKHPQLHDYYFGQRDPDRFGFTVGRDLRLEPPQAGPPLNYFVYPYVEVGRKEHTNVSIAFSFKDSEDTPTASHAGKQVN